MAKKADLVKEAEALGVDTDGLTVAELEEAIGEAQASQTDEAPAEEPAEETPALGPDSVALPDVVASVEGRDLKLSFGEWVESEWHEHDSHVIGHDEAIALADAIPDLARAALNNRNLG